MSKITCSINAYGMHCKSCEVLIENNLKDLNGIIEVTSNYKESSVDVTYESELCDEDLIKTTIENTGYSTTKNNSMSKLIGISIIILAILFLSSNALLGFDTNSMIQDASLAMLFVVGVLSSLHCVGMCGGIMLTQTLNNNILNDKKSSLKVALMYNLGRILSYTILGGIIGLVGSVFSVSIKVQGFIQILAASLMILSGLNMLGFKLFNLDTIKIPFLNKKCNNNNKSPFIVGILNGFMPCGPLQTMQFYALGTGSFIMGALSMFVFALGTVPLMVGFGYISSRLSKGLSNKIFKYSGIFIIILGLSMGQRGFALTGINLLPNIGSQSISSSDFAPVVDGSQQVTITADRFGYTPSHKAIKGDLPVVLTIKAKEVTGCNYSMYFPQYDQYVDLSNGDVVVKIHPNNEDINFTCWMGMIRGNLKVG